jgi:hypothetical protein
MTRRTVADEIAVSADGDISLPLLEVLTGRGFVTGKSGSGKSNTTSVIVEEILAAGRPLLVIDTDGEYWGLKEQYEILHLGAGENCDVRVTADHAETIVDLALEEEVPTILDVSAFLSSEDAQTIINRVVTELFRREKRTRKPFLLVVEEVHEYIPEGGGLDEAGKTLIQVAKRGRKHGLGLCGVSQRPASVDKNFITQCDWIVWHRLTWKNDTKVVRKILGKEASEEVQHLDTGDGLLMTDWDEQLNRTHFRKKRTYDAGATPGMDDFDPPPLVPIPRSVLDRFPDDAVVEADRLERTQADRDAATNGESDADAGSDPGGSEEQPDADGEPEDSLASASGESPPDSDPPGDGERLPDAGDDEGAVEVLEADGASAELEAVPSGKRPRQARPVGRAPRTGTPNQPIIVEFGELILHVWTAVAGAIASVLTAVADTVRGRPIRGTLAELDAEEVAIFVLLATAVGSLMVAVALLVG